MVEILLAMKKESSAYIEMLFENRNKAYGAYDLRVNYEKHLIRSFGIALLISGLFFLVPFILTKILTARHKANSVLTTIPVDLTKKFFIEKMTMPEMRTAPVVKKLSPVSAYKVVKTTEPEKTTAQKPDEPVSSGENLGTGIITDSSLAFNGNGIQDDSVSTETMSIASVDVLPAFPGGEDALMKFLAKNIHYPVIARENRITGRVYAGFVVDEEGNIESVSIIRGLGYGMDDEVIRVMGMMPKWKPGRYQNRNVKTAFTIPVFFSLK